MRLRFSWKSYCLAAVLLVTIALFPLAHIYSTFPGDELALVKFQGLQTGWLDTSSLALDKLGDIRVAPSLVFGVAVLLYVLRFRTDAGIVALTLVPMLVGNALKRVVERPRPDYLLIGPAPESLSFPSGHAVYAFLFGGILIYLTGKLVPTPVLRRGVQAVLALLILAMGASRVYLGMHWPSDVIGGYLFAGVALLGLIGLRNLLLGR